MFRFNRNYDDLEQVAEFLPTFEQVRNEIVKADRYPYNDDFKGGIPGIEGDDEDTAIYLLQGLRRQREENAKVERLLADGYEEVEQLEEVERFRQVVLCPRGRMRGEWAEYEGARLVPETKPGQAEITGRISAVLPKGNRTRGHLVNGRRVIALR